MVNINPTEFPRWDFLFTYGIYHYSLKELQALSDNGSETTIPINVKLDAWGGQGTVPEWVTWYKNHAQWKKFNLIDRNNNPI